VTVNTAILTGGLSRRFGSPKQDIDINGETLLARTMRIAREAGAVNPAEYGKDLRPGHGPLGGLETILTGLAGQYVVVVACDMPGLSAVMLRTLWSHPSSADVVVPVVAGRRHPLCARWSAAALPAVSAAIDAGRLSVQRLLDTLSVVEIDEASLTASGVDAGRAVWNVNRPGDLEGGPPK